MREVANSRQQKIDKRGLGVGLMALALGELGYGEALEIFLKMMEGPDK